MRTIEIELTARGADEARRRIARDIRQIEEDPDAWSSPITQAIDLLPALDSTNAAERAVPQILTYLQSLYGIFHKDHKDHVVHGLFTLLPRLHEVFNALAECFERAEKNLGDTPNELLGACKKQFQLVAAMLASLPAPPGKAMGTLVPRSRWSRVTSQPWTGNLPGLTESQRDDTSLLRPPDG